MKSKFEVNGKEFVIVYSIFGHEKYIYDGEPIRSGWSFGMNSTEIFSIGSDELRVENNVSLREFSSQAYLNGKLIVDDLFPEITKKIREKKQRSWKSTIVSMVASCLLTMALITLYNTFS